MTAVKTEVHERMTRDQAFDKMGGFPPGQTWDEASQALVPRSAIPPAPPTAEEEVAELERGFERFRRNRAAILRFVKTYLEEADYDKDGKLVPGKTRDFYHFPGSPPDQKTLTKRGGSKLAQLYRWRRATPKVEHLEVTKDHTSATVSVTILDPFGAVVGSGISSCSTSEGGFQGGNINKYGGYAFWDKEQKQYVIKRPADYRAAQNDVVARASKRAFVAGVIVAAAIEDIFVTESAESDGEDDEQVPTKAPTPAQEKRAPTLPAGKFGKWAGKPLKDVPPDVLVQILTAIRTQFKNPAAWATLVEQIEEELESARRHLEADDDLPFD